MMACLDSLTIGDTREVWTLTPSGTVTSYGDKFCISVGTNPNDSKLAWLEPCDDGPR